MARILRVEADIGLSVARARVRFTVILDRPDPPYLWVLLDEQVPFRIVTVDSRDIAYAGAARGGRLKLCDEVEERRSEAFE